MFPCDTLQSSGYRWLVCSQGCVLLKLHNCAQADIREEEGFLIFDLCRGDDKTFKTKAAIRQIPVHHLLVRCGLLKHRDQCKGKRLYSLIYQDQSQTGLTHSHFPSGSMHNFL